MSRFQIFNARAATVEPTSKGGDNAMKLKMMDGGWDEGFETKCT